MTSEAASPPLPGMVTTAVQQIAAVVEQAPMARDTYRLRLRCPEIAEQIVPGQFFMIRAPGRNDPLLGRPFALYDIYEEAGRPAGVDFGYITVGRMTRLMAACRGFEELEIWGPLGNGFPLPGPGRLMLVAGGIGQTPFLAVAHEALGRRRYGRPPRELPRLPASVTLCYGARSAAYLAGLDDFRDAGLEVRVATDDGSRGYHGFVTGLLEEALGCPEPPDQVYCCGPEPMMRATAALCAKHGVPCWLSLETPMACGFGACFSCVAPVRLEDGSWDYRRTCVEGPVFPAERLVL